MQTKWDYRTLWAQKLPGAGSPSAAKALERVLREHGDDGWELVGVELAGCIVFRRERLDEGGRNG